MATTRGLIASALSVRDAAMAAERSRHPGRLSRSASLRVPKPDSRYRHSPYSLPHCKNPSAKSRRTCSAEEDRFTMRV